MTIVLAAVLFSVRPIDAIAANTLERAAARSAIVRSLLDTLEQSDVIVHIQSSRQLPAGIGGMTRFVANRGGHRYLRITISTELSPEARIAMLAHELQHAREIAGSSAQDVMEMRTLFRQRGKQDGDYFETQAAQRLERLVRTELRALEAEPVVKFHH